MTRTVLSRLLGVFLLVYGLGAIILGWWAYNVTHEAFVSVRNFTAVFEQERSRAASAVQAATDLLGLRGTDSSAAAPSGGSSVVREAQGLGDRIRGLFDSSRPKPTPQAGASPPAQSSEGSGMLDQLQRQITQAGSGWSALGEGPLKKGMLDQVEMATNAVLLWMGVHGAVSIVVGFFFLLWTPRPAVVYASQPPPGWYPTQQHPAAPGGNPRDFQRPGPGPAYYPPPARPGPPGPNDDTLPGTPRQR